MCTNIYVTSYSLRNEATRGANYAEFILGRVYRLKGQHFLRLVEDRLREGANEDMFKNINNNIDSAVQMLGQAGIINLILITQDKSLLPPQKFLRDEYRLTIEALNRASPYKLLIMSYISESYIRRN
ncbi:MAG: hypothetical protein U9O94_08025 [Nanoarchaeota archaeon]|nr:hypothetical protein [Nanoarchaeota archaeon]